MHQFSGPWAPRKWQSIPIMYSGKFLSAIGNIRLVYNNITVYQRKRSCWILLRLFCIVPWNRGLAFKRYYWPLELQSFGWASGGSPLDIGCLVRIRLMMAINIIQFQGAESAVGSVQKESAPDSCWSTVRSMKAIKILQVQLMQCLDLVLHWRAISNSCTDSSAYQENLPYLGGKQPRESIANM